MCLRVGFSIGAGRKLKVGVKRLSIVRGEGDTVVVSRMDVVQNKEGGLHVTAGRFVVVGRKEGVGSSKIRTSALGEPANAANKALVGVLALKEGRIVIRLGALRNGING